MNKDELIGKLQMVYVGDKNALNELIGYYDGLKQGIDELQKENQELRADYGTKAQVERNLLKEENQQLKEVIDKAISHLDLFISDTNLSKYDTLKILMHTKKILKEVR